MIARLGKTLRNERLWWLLGLAVLLLGKLWLVRYEDIAAILGPHDDLWFMKRARVAYWFFSGYDAMKFIKEPGYPLFVTAVHHAGVPLRLATEVLFLGTAALVGQAVRLRTRATWLALLVVAAAVYHPTAMLAFQRATADALHGILMLGLGGVWFWILTAPRRALGGFLLAGLVSALMVISRPEAALVHLWSLALLGVWAFLLALQCRRNGVGSWRAVVRPVAWSLLLFMLPQVVLVGSVRAMNRWKVGISSVSEQSEPSYQRALAALMSVQPEPSAAPYTSVRIETLRRLGERCPTVARLVPFFSEDYVAQWKSAMAAGYEAPSGEIGAGHFHWALRDGVHTVFKPASGRETAALFARIADEVEAALDRGEFARRRVWSTSVAPDFILGSERHRASIAKVWDQVARPWFGPIKDSDDAATVSYFDGMALRRHLSHQASASRSEPVAVSGWCLPAEASDRLASVRLVSSGDDRLSVAVLPRPDVIEAVGAKLGDGDMAGFSVEGQVGAGDARLVLESRSGRRLELSLVTLRGAKTGAVATYPDDSGQAWQVLVDKTQKSEQERLVPEWNFFSRTCVAVQAFYPWLLAGTALLALVVFAWCRAWRRPECLLVIAALAVLPASRLLIFSMIDASMFPGTEPRYLLGASLVVHLLPLLAVAVLLAGGRGRGEDAAEMSVV